MEESVNSINILYIDDERVLLNVTKDFLPHFGNFNIDTAISAEEGLQKLKNNNYDVIVSDYQMADMDGLELLEKLRSEENYIPFIIFTGRGREEVAIQALNAGADFYIQKGGDPKAQFTELSHNIRQIVEKKRFEKSLIKSDYEKNLILNTIDDPMAHLDTKYNIVWGNKKFHELVGKEHKDIIGRHCYEMIFGRNEICQWCRIPFVNSTRDISSHEVLFSGRSMFFSTYPVENQLGEIIGYIEKAVDVTELRKAEKGLQKANKKLNLLSSITRHDILNQIMALDTYLELIRNAKKDTKNIDELVNSCINIKSNIGRQILFTREYENLGVEPPLWQDIQECFENAKKDIMPNSISCFVDTGGINIYADPFLEKVFYCLIDNSNRHGGNVTEIRLHYSFTDNELVITYEDDGVGIDYSEKESIFKRCHGKNTGMGLFLSREILDITGLSIKENGEPGKGARFEIQVPVGK